MERTVEFQFRRRYSLPPTDSRFLDAAREEIMVDWWAHRFADDPSLRNEVVMDPEDFEAELAEMEAASIAAEGGDPPPPGDGGDWEPLVEDTYGEPQP